MEDRSVSKLLQAGAIRAPVPAAWPAPGRRAVDDRVTSSI